MGALVTFLLTNPAIAALIVAIVGGLGFGVQQRLAGAKAERNKQAADRLAARSDADKIDQAVAGMSDAEVLERQARWSREKNS